MKIGNPAGELEKLEMNMTPMIDVCFQLIIFFMLSLSLYLPEGDFNVKMPPPRPKQGLPDDSQLPPLAIRLTADADGKLLGIRMGDRNFTSFRELGKQVREIVEMSGGASASSVEAEVNCDYNLKYEYAVEALSAVSGYLSEDGRGVVRLIEKIKFAPPRKNRE